MKIALIGAAGNLGQRIARTALEKGHLVKGFCRHGENDSENAQIIHKSLFDITEEDLQDCDVFISAFGSGFQADPVINYEAFIKYIALNEKSQRPTVVIAGAGSLYTDQTRKVLCCEQPDYPDFLYGISKNIALGIEKMVQADFPWTIVSPPEQFDSEKPGTGDYRVEAADYLLYNSQGKSYAAYDDVAAAMVRIAEEQNFIKQRVVVVSEG